MKAKRDAKRATYGVTLIETMVAVAIILVAVTGAMSYQYYTVMDARKADLHMEAARLGLTFLEGWKGAGCTTDFDPQTDFANGQSAEFTAALGVWAMVFLGISIIGAVVLGGKKGGLFRM